jgi:dipeptidyl aminopeptidase/acylaminoacyl peptidase
LIASCELEPTTDAAISTDIIGVRYAAHGDNTFDVYLPAKRNGNTRTIILLHGGFWNSGDKNDLTAYAKFFRDQGFACVNMNYRLTNTNENNFHPAQVNDVGKVIDYVTAKALDWHISPSRFGLLGYSAGAHIALLYTYASNSNGKVKTVVSMAGPSNLTDTTGVSPQIVSIVTGLIGSTYKSNPAAYEQASPIFHVSAQTKPTFLVHGKIDKTVPYKQSVDLQAKLQQFNVRNELRLYNNAGHDFADPATINSLLTDFTAWFQETLK